jgi:N-acetylmuramoyl-L-alanine amidase-like protein/fibronectin type III domain protein
MRYRGPMRRQLGWLCLLPALASLTTTHAVAAGAPSAPAPNSASSAPAVASVPDYGPAAWVPADPANYTVANRGHDYPVQLIIIHDTESSYASAIQDFQDPTWAASAHYVVSEQGDVTQMVAEKDIAWHAGNWDYNTRAIGIEHEGYAWSCSCYTDAEYDASARLAASICSRWGVPINNQNVIGHDQVPDPNNPGLFGGTDHHTDPGPYWDWTDYLNRAAYYASLLPSPPHLMPDPSAVLNSSTSATVTWQPAGTCHSPITGYTVADAPHNLVMNLPASATSATFTGLQAGVTYTFTVTANNAYGQDSATAQWRCLLAQISATPAAPQLSGTTVQLSGSSTGCPNPRYQFWILAPGSSTWTNAQSYSAGVTFNWDTRGAAAGTYHLGVWARDVSSAGAVTTSLGNFDSFAAATYTLTTQPCASAAASARPSSPPTPGTAVTITGSASGCPKPLYEFWILPPGGNTWTITQAYSTSATFNWSTNGLVGGRYLFSVWVRDTSSLGTSCNSLGCNDAFAAVNYTLTTTTCASVTASATPASPATPGTAVTFAAAASGCPNPLFQFWVLSPDSSSWTVARAYSAATAFSWNTSGLPTGVYHFGVWVRDSSSAGASCNSLGCDDAFAAIDFTLTSGACTSVTASAGPASPQPPGTTVTFTGVAAGCGGAPLYEYWMLAPGSSTWTSMQAYSTNATFNWSTAGLVGGLYHFGVWVRDTGSSGVSCNSLGCNDAFVAIDYTLTSTPCASVTASAAPASPRQAGTSVTYTGVASGCPSALYEFWILAPGSSTWVVAQAYSASPTFNWSTSGLPAGVYRFSVWVRDSSSAGAVSTSLGNFDAFVGINYTLN